MQDRLQNHGAAIPFQTLVIVDGLAGDKYLICFYVYSSIRFLLNIIGNFKKNLIFKISNPPNAPKWSSYCTKLGHHALKNLYL
jgi:hypothetical protein